MSRIRGRHFLSSGIALLILLSIVSPTISAKTNIPERFKGFNKGVSWKPVLPLKKVTFVNFDKDSYLDDYAYLAAVPTAVFYDKSRDRLISHPLLFYQDPYLVKDEKERTLDARKGIDYFMEDWLSYCNGRMDQMVLINVDREKVKQWPAKDIVEIKGEDPYEIAAKIALHDWSYSDEVVVAVIDDNIKNPCIIEKGKLYGRIPAGYSIDVEEFEMEEPHIGVGGNYRAFEIEEPYKYVVAHLLLRNVLEDLDLQLYDDKLGMTDASSKWNILYGPSEVVGSYVYNYGKWEIGITYMPTQHLPGKMERLYKNVDEEKGFLAMLGSNKNLVKIDVKLYPGVDLELNKTVPYGCRDAEFRLKWNDPNVALGMVILDTYGAETAISPTKEEIIEGVKKGITERVIRLHMLGETRGERHYTICVFSMDNVTYPVDFTIEYHWHQNISRESGDALASASEGSILASILNVPLLYASRDKLPEITKSTLHKLGVKEIHFIDLGGHSSPKILRELKNVGKVKIYRDYKRLYGTIRKLTGRNDVIFSTIDPWSYYYAGEQVPAGEWRGALFIGPASYIASHHGVPLLIVDNHPQLSQAVVWHQKFWEDTAHIRGRPRLPSVACMVLTGRAVIDFLEKLGYNLPKNKEDLEAMITIADQFEIGPTWDRTFVGRLLPGRFCGSPVDTAYWISRSIFYPALIFENPATNPSGIKLINGSKSMIKPYIGKLMKPFGTDLVIVKPSKEERFVYPVLHTYNCHLLNFNKIARKHWGGIYTCANGIIPYETPSPFSIDVGVTDKVGAYYPDINPTVVAPIYARKAGYSNAFSTNFSATVENLNRGVIMWIEIIHGGNTNNGSLGMWNPDSPYLHEPNPWRAYERPLLALKNLDEFIQFIPEYLERYGSTLPKVLYLLSRFLTKPIDIILDIVLVDRGCTEEPDVAVTNPDIGRLGSIFAVFSDAFPVDMRIKESKGLSLIPILGRRFRSYHDGIVITPLPGGENVLVKYNGFDFDDHLENLHSCGINAASCLISNTYLHLVFIRHGSVYQIIDPWSTSWYSSLWIQSIPRDLALGYTIGQAYERGMAMVGVEYLVNQWWWDLNENVVYFGDPDLRVWTPKNKYSLVNHWEREDVNPLRWDGKKDIYVDGHYLFGAKFYPHAHKPFDIRLIVITSIIIIVAILVISFYSRKVKGRKSRKGKK
ncbi:MAG: hypothetical protein J7L20_05235 [Thermoplasmata archaeon]|nr:hypothetical protein [Thermoplasmata archaeon]